MSTLSLQNTFEIKCILDNIDIRLSCRIESGVKQLIAIVTGTGDIVLHYIYGELTPVIRRLPWFTENCKTVQAICFDPTATWLLVVSLNGSLYIIPALSLVDKRQRIDCKWSINDLTHFPKHNQTPDSKPSSIVWWQTLDSNQNALVGYKNGAIGLISLTDGRCLATCSVNDGIAKLYLCQDNSLECVSLLINGESGQQWKLTLEQHSNGYIWPPEANTNSDNSAASRLQCLKQMGADKLASLKQRFTEARGARRDSDSSSESTHSGPELLPHLCDTFFAPQYARNRYLFSAFYKPTSLLTIHAMDIESAPLYVHKLATKSSYLLLTNRLIYVVNDDFNNLSVVSTQLSECRLDGDVEFNTDSLLAQFDFAKADEKILNIYKLSDTSLFNESHYKEEGKRDRHNKESVLSNSINQLKLRKPKIDTCVIITTNAIYKIILNCSPIKQFITLITEDFNVEKAEKLAIIFGLNLQELLESCGDLLISEGSYHQGLILYKQAKVHLLKRVLKLAVSGDSRALLKFVHLCLSASKVDMSTATKIHMGNLAVMAYTELILRHNGHVRITTTRDFMNFLRYEEFYDQVLAVNVACQSRHWNIVTLLAKSRSLQPEIVTALSQMLQSIGGAGVNNYEFLLTLSEPSLTQSLLLYPLFGQRILYYIRTHLDKFPVNILQRFALQLDPSQPCALPIVKRLYQSRRISSSLDSTLDTVDTQSLDQITINAKDFIEIFICVVATLVSKTSTDEYNIDLLHNVELPEKRTEPPFLIKFPSLRPLSCGYEHAAVIRNGEIYTMGMANSGCLGFGPMLTQSSPPKLVDTLSELKLKMLSISCGRRHCLVLTDFGVYSWGSNSHGQLGIGSSTQESSYPLIVGDLTDNLIVDVVAGQYHSMALTANGRVYTWGWGIHGQLGHGTSDSEYFPKPLHFEHKVAQIAAGHAHSLVLTEDGKLYGFGSNAFGQLETNHVEGNKITVPVCISVLPDIYMPIKKIATAYFHNIAVRNDEEVYTWGASPQEVRLSQSKYSQKLNGSGTKGHEPWKSSVHIFDGTKKEPVDEIAVGFRHSALLHNGKLLLCKNMEDEMSPPKLKDRDLGILGQRFLHVSCGPDFTIAMDHSGKLLAWGNNAMAQTLLGKPQEDDPRHLDGKVVIFKNTKRVLKIPHNLQTNSEAFPIEIPGLPTMAITFSPPDHQCLFNRQFVPYAVRLIENNHLYNGVVDRKPPKLSSPVDQSEGTPSHKFGNKTLHYILETYCGHYDTESVLSRCLKVGNLQAASKIAKLNGHYSDSLGFQLSAFKKYLDLHKLDFAMNLKLADSEMIDSNKQIDLYELCNLKHSNSNNRTNYLSGSSSLDSIQQWSDDFEDQGGRESPCNISEVGDIRQSMSQYVQSIKSDDSPPISSVSQLISESPYVNLKHKVSNVDLISQIKDAKTKNVVQLASYLIEFYIKQIYSSENHILMQNILLKCIDFWLSNNLPVPILENVLLKNMDKYFYPLSILLFCKNFNNNLGEEIIKKDDGTKHQRPSRFLREFSTKFCLQLCSMVLENVNKA